MYVRLCVCLYVFLPFNRALRYFSEAIDAAPASWSPLPALLGNRAATFMMLERYLEAAEDCERALLLAPGMIRLHDRRGRALLRIGSYVVVVAVAVVVLVLVAEVVVV